MTARLPTWQVELEAETSVPSLRRLVIASIVTVVLGFGSFLLWSLTASLDSAVPANGSFVAHSKRKTITILEPGILKEMPVKEGERVKAGQVLLRLDETQAEAQLGQLKAQYWAMVAKSARLDAEQADLRALKPPANLVTAASQDPTIASTLNAEARLFAARLQTYEGIQSVQRKKIAQLSEQIVAFKAQATATASRIASTEEEMKAQSELLAKGFTTKPKFAALDRARSELRGNLGELSAKEAEARQAIGQAELEIESTRNTRLSDTMKELQEARALIADLAQRIRGAEDILQRKDIVAPEDGTVTDVKFFTPGSSIVAGQPIMDLVPADDKVVIEAAVSPIDIEHVHAGQKVNVRLTAYKQHKVPVLTGRLIYVSADRQADAKGEPFFLARAELDPGVLSRHKGVEVYPGMPAEILIINGERLAIDYFISPITDSLRRALREQ